MPLMEDKFIDFEAFWPFYMSQHRLPLNRKLHFVGTTLGIILLVFALAKNCPYLLLGVPVLAYGFAWVGHFAFEKNRPATFKYPLWSFRGDLRMWRLMLEGKLWHGRT